MSKALNKNIYIIGGAILFASAFGIVSSVVYSKRKRQAEFDNLMAIINSDVSPTSQSESKGSGFDKDLYKKNPNCVSITPSEAKSQATSLYSAKGGYLKNDDEEAVETFFRNVKSKCDLSRVADYFYGMYKTDLLVFLKSFLSASEMEKYVFKYSNKLR